MTVTLRTATAADIPLIAHLHATAWHQSYQGLLPDDLLAKTTVASRTAFWNKAFANPDLLSVIVAERDGIPVAFASLWQQRDPPNTAIIHHLYVLKPHQRRGIGRLLFSSLMAVAAARHCKTVALDTLAAGPSSLFYKSLQPAAAAHHHTTRLLGVEVDVIRFEWPIHTSVQRSRGKSLQPA